MEHCPPEIWHKIFLSACTDGGFTGRSLLLTSHSFRAVAAPVCLHSVALKSLKQVITFATTFEKAGANTIIRHLLISMDEKHDNEVYLNSLLREGLRRAYPAILERAAPTLLTLFINHYDFTSFCKHTSLRFPVLRDLAVHSLSRYQPDNDLDYPFPLLERVHISTVYNTSGSGEPFVALATMAPHLTTLRLSDIREDVALPRFLRTLLRVPDPPGGAPAPQEGIDPEEIVKYLPCLTNVLVEPFVFHDYAAYGMQTEAEEHTTMMTGLDTTAKACVTRREGEPRLVVMPSVHALYSAESWLSHWLEVVEGGDGPWTGAASVPSSKGYEPPPRPEVLNLLRSAGVAL